MENENEIGNLESLLAPISYGEEYPLPRDVLGKPSLTTGVHFNGTIASNCEWGWTYSGPVIRCFSLPVSETEEFQLRGPIIICPEPYQFPTDYFITCVTELLLYNPKFCNGVAKLVVGLNFRNTSGGLVIFDPLRAQPMKLIILPSPVKSVTVISHFDDGGFNSHFFNEAMMAMVGIVAVGLAGGQVIILDLGLDHLPHSPNVFYYKNVFAKGHHTPVFVTPHEPNIALKRHKFIGEKKLIALPVLNESEDDNEMNSHRFHYCEPDGTTVKTFQRKNVKVASIQYIAPIGLLVVGFDFGGFQLWRVDSLQLVCTSPLPVLPVLPNTVFGFSFSQPIDDPKNYCYLWVMYGKSGLEMHPAHVELYCLEFQDKPWVENVGSIYKGFKQCIKKLSFKLEDCFDEVDENNDDAEGRYYVRPLKIWSSPNSAGNLTYFSWESQRMGIYYVGIFDLNQWYSNRMMESIRTAPITGLCPYWVAIPVETTDEHHAIPICDVQIIPKSLERWKNPHCTLDIHLYPASLSFEAITLSQSATSNFQFFGVQEKLIRKLIEDGTNLMLQPSNIKRMFRTYGLRPILPQQYDDTMPKDMADRFYIFSALLDNRRPALIIQFAASWLDGAFANVGCSVDLILDWISAYTSSLRVMAQDHWDDLHRCHLEFLAPETQHFIHYSNFVWESLLAVFATITRPDVVFLAREGFINNLSTGLNKIVRYSAALRMMFNAEVLPEKSDCDIISTMSGDHDARRTEVTQAIHNCNFLDDTFKSIRPMMIDYLLEAFDEDELREQWHVEPNEPLYPPKHIGYVLNMFLMDHENPKDIARVAAYFLLDIRDVVTAEQKNKLRGDYHSVMQLSAEEEAEVYHLWLMDHGYFNEAMIFMSHPGRLSSYDLPWCAGIVVCTALGMEDAVTRLLKRSCPAVLAPLYIKLMSRSAGLFSTIVNTSSFEILSETEDFLMKFFKVSHDEGYLGKFISTSLRHVPSKVTEVLIDYLRRNQSFQCADWLLAIYVLLGDTKNLREQYTRMKKLYEGTLLEEQKMRWIFREKVVLSILSSESAKSNGVMDFIRKCDKTAYPTTVRQRQTIVIRPQLVPTTPRHVEGDDFDKFMRSKNKAPAQHQRLRLLRAQQSTTLSPLRRYAARLQSDLRTPCRGGADTDDHVPSSDSTIKTPQAASSTPVSRAMMSILNYPNEEDVPVDEDEDENIMLNNSNTSNSMFDDGMDSSNRAKSQNYPTPSPINLKSLLEPPQVNHKESRKSMSFIGQPPSSLNRSVSSSASLSVYFTPGGVGQGVDKSLHSIMKKRDSTTRRNMELRFLDISQTSEIPEAAQDVDELSNIFKASDDEDMEELTSQYQPSSTVLVQPEPISSQDVKNSPLPGRKTRSRTPLVETSPEKPRDVKKRSTSEIPRVEISSENPKDVKKPRFETPLVEISPSKPKDVKKTSSSGTPLIATSLEKRRNVKKRSRSLAPLVETSPEKPKDVKKSPVSRRMARSRTPLVETSPEKPKDVEKRTISLSATPLVETTPEKPRDVKKRSRSGTALVETSLEKPRDVKKRARSLTPLVETSPEKPMDVEKSPVPRRMGRPRTPAAETFPTKPRDLKKRLRSGTPARQASQTSEILEERHEAAESSNLSSFLNLEASDEDLEEAGTSQHQPSPTALTQSEPIPTQDVKKSPVPRRMARSKTPAVEETSEQHKDDEKRSRSDTALAEISPEKPKDVEKSPVSRRMARSRTPLVETSPEKPKDVEKSSVSRRMARSRTPLVETSPEKPKDVEKSPVSRRMVRSRTPLVETSPEKPKDVEKRTISLSATPLVETTPEKPRDVKKRSRSGTALVETSLEKPRDVKKRARSLTPLVETSPEKPMDVEKSPVPRRMGRPRTPAAETFPTKPRDVKKRLRSRTPARQASQTSEIVEERHEAAESSHLSSFLNLEASDEDLEEAGTSQHQPSTTALTQSEPIPTQDGKKSPVPRRMARSKTPTVEETSLEQHKDDEKRSRSDTALVEISPENPTDVKKMLRSRTPALHAAQTSEIVEERHEAAESINVSSFLALDTSDENLEEGTSPNQPSSTILAQTEQISTHDVKKSPVAGRKTRSRTPLVETSPEKPKDVEKSPVPHRRARSKTPAVEETSLEIPTEGRKRLRSGTLLVETSPEEPKDVKKSLVQRRRSRSKTPLVETSPEKPMTRSRSRIGSHDSSSSSISPSKLDISSIAEFTSETKPRSARKQRRTVKGFVPELSTVIEDSLLLDPSILNVTQKSFSDNKSSPATRKRWASDSTGLSSISKTGFQIDRTIMTTTTEEVEEEVQVLDLSPADEQEEQTMPRKRSRRTKPPTDDDDDAKSDISVAQSTRSVRTARKKPPRNVRARSVQ